MTTYDELLSQLKASTTSAYEYIPKMCDALREEDKHLTNEDIKDKVTKDCLEAGLAKGTIVNNIPEKYKDPELVKAGKKGAAKKKEKEQEIEVLTNGSVAHPTGAQQAPESPKENESATSGYQAEIPEPTPEDLKHLDKRKEYQAPPPTKQQEEFLTKKVNDLMNEVDSLKVENKKILELNKSQSQELKAIKNVQSTGFLQKDIDCTNHSMYIKAQVKIEEWRQKANELEERIDALDKVIFQAGNQIESPPEVFQVPKDADLMTEYFYGDVSPIQGVQKLKQILSSVSKIDIGWRVLEQ